MSLSTADFHLLDVVMNGVGLVPLLLIATLVFGCGKKRPQPKAGQKGKNNKSNKSKKANGSKRSAKSAKASKTKSKRSASSKSSKSGAKSASLKTAKPTVEKKSSLRVSAEGSVKTARQPSLRQSSIRQPQAQPSLRQPQTPLPEQYAEKSLQNEKYAQPQQLKTARESSRKGSAEAFGRSLELEPVELRFKPQGGTQNVSVRNNTAERQAIKVKCSDNTLYRVNPVYAFVGAGETLKVDIVRQNGAPKVDKLIIVTAEAGSSENQPKELFRKGTHPMMVLPLLAGGSTPA